MKIRRAAERGGGDHGWLKTRHTFSFADYYDPAHMGFRNLRVINEDRVAPGGGFPPHSHRHMEIVSYVLEGALQHRDSMGNGSIIRPGDVQRMSAGTGVTHSEYNASDREPVHFLQIWIVPARNDLPPSYEQQRFEPDGLRGVLRLVGSPDGADGSVRLNADASIHATRLAADQAVRFELRPGRHAWLHVARGSITVGDETLETSDGAAIVQPGELLLRGRGDEAEVLIFDLG